jgi:hypothetical protein
VSLEEKEVRNITLPYHIYLTVYIFVLLSYLPFSVFVIRSMLYGESTLDKILSWSLY